MPESTWDDDTIQFPRFIAELEAAGVFEEVDGAIWNLLLESMDLTTDDVNQLISRAQAKWDEIKERT